jgi:hypothetical protein
MNKAVLCSAVVVATSLHPAASRATQFAHGGLMRYDRIALTERLLSELPSRRYFAPTVKPEAISPIARYRKIHRVDFLPPGSRQPIEPTGLGIVTDLNDLGQITYIPNPSTKPDTPSLSYVIDDDGTHHLLSGALAGSSADEYAEALNDVAGVTGSYFGGNDIQSNNVAWLLRGSEYDVSYVGAIHSPHAYSKAYAINNLNVSAGTTAVTSPPFNFNAALFSAASGTQTLLPLENPFCGIPAPQYQAEATGINDLGDVVGYERSFGNPGSCSSMQAVRFSPTGYAQPLFASQPSDFESVAEAVNASGNIVGYIGKLQLKAFLYSKARNTVTYIPRPLGEHQLSSFALAINGHDDVVGIIGRFSGGAQGAFLFTRGRSYDLNSLLPANSGWTIVSAIAINDSGEIIGQGYYFDPHTQQTIVGSYAMKP